MLRSFPSKKVPTDTLVPFASNSRTHSDAQIEQICASIGEWGFTNPIIIDENNAIIAGHGRVMAAKKLRIDEVPCVVVSGWSEEQKRAYVIADNKLALNAGWDEGLLFSELALLDECDFDISLTGFNLGDLPEPAIGLPEEDEITPPESPTTKPGYVWLLGAHRVMCADATDIGSVEILMGGKKADMVFTDPPYNTGMTASNDSTRLSHMFDDSYTDEEWQDFMERFTAAYDHATSDVSAIYVCLDWRRSYELIPHLKKNWQLSNVIVWDKVVHGLGSDYKYTYELIHVCKKGKPKIRNKDGDKEYQDVWRIQRKMGRDDDHATKKPTELCERAIRHASAKGQLVLDLFGGSGSTLIAADQLGRKCYMMELSPAYCDVIVNRWQSLTGKQATLDGTNKTFAEMKDMV